MTRFFGSVLILSVLFATGSCLNRQFVDGKSEFVSVSDTMLNDSSLFVGYAHWVDWPVNYTFQGPFEIWVDDSNLSANSDSCGYYFIKTIPGTYTIKCQSEGNGWTRLVEETANLKIEKNKKIRIDFYLGYTVE